MFSFDDLKPFSNIENTTHIQTTYVAPDGRTVARLLDKMSNINYHFIMIELVDMNPRPMIGESVRAIQTGWAPLVESQVKFYGFDNDKSMVIGIADEGTMQYKIMNTSRLVLPKSGPKIALMDN